MVLFRFGSPILVGSVVRKHTQTQNEMKDGETDLCGKLIKWKRPLRILSWSGFGVCWTLQCCRDITFFKFKIGGFGQKLGEDKVIFSPPTTLVVTKLFSFHQQLGWWRSYFLSTSNSGGDEVIFSPPTTGVVTKLFSLHQQLWWWRSYFLSTNNSGGDEVIFSPPTTGVVTKLSSLHQQLGWWRSYYLSTSNSGGDEVIFSPPTTGVVTKLFSLHQQLWWWRSYFLSTNN